eukprot:CAMPEP_0116894688 /NCGR_PEP_ID=MMETSP0467-20121206/4400_1 /TAXON_ID=283647 /ORGANISM="Mesodinium pulex, Strain SPMC105" /LENGTH=56 /DNA_ID=CAMNT_0004565045 /DNA_START=2657 /DNA_END=2827 /DNA_ORIENTATION=-
MFKRNSAVDSNLDLLDEQLLENDDIEERDQREIIAEKEFDREIDNKDPVIKNEKTI